MYFSAISRCSRRREDRRAVLRAVIGALAVELRRIVNHREKNLQQLAVADLASGRRRSAPLSACPVSPRPTSSYRRGLGAAGVARHGLQHAVRRADRRLARPRNNRPRKRRWPSRASDGRLVDSGRRNRPPPLPPLARSRRRPQRDHGREQQRRHRKLEYFICTPSWHRSSTERERVGRHAGIQELDLERPVANSVRLADQLIQPLLGHVPDAVASMSVP